MTIFVKAYIIDDMRTFLNVLDHSISIYGTSRRPEVQTLGKLWSLTCFQTMQKLYPRIL